MYVGIHIAVTWQDRYEPKTLQYLMGHSDIGVTLNTYTHLGAKDAREELERLNLAGTSKGKMPRKVVNMP